MTDAFSENAEEQQLRSWMRLAQNGDAGAYQALLVRLKALLQSFIRNQLHKRAPWAIDSAEDIVQEAMIGIHSKRHTYDPNHPFLPWFYAIARYKLIDSLRANGKRRKDVELDAELADRTPDTRATAPDSWLAGADAETLMSELPEKQRQVLELVKLRGLSVREASERTGYSSSDIKVTVHRAIKALQKKYEAHADD